MSTAAVSESPLRVALLGAPNSGKTTIFNALTGARAKVGNYPGVTVERREGVIKKSTRSVRVLDLPGSYSLRGETPDEQVVEQVLAGELDIEGAPSGRSRLAPLLEERVATLIATLGWWGLLAPNA